jgi:dimethylhistidine N-methyltransferase
MIVNTRTAESRLEIHQPVGVGDRESSFAEDIRLGLTADPKRIPPKCFYDPLGSLLFEAICLLPEYYVTRAENKILLDHCETIIDSLDLPVRIVELGSGAATKTCVLLSSILQRQKDLEYVPIDISQSAIEQSTDALLHSFPGLRISAIVGNYESGLDWLHREMDEWDPEVRTAAVFLGSSLGNLDPEEAIALLRRIRKVLRPKETLLLGTDLVKSADILIPAYDDALAVTAAFNKNLLVRINRELNGEFDLRKFRHRVVYNNELARIEMYLESVETQCVIIRDLDMEVRFAKGEIIHTENSQKFDGDRLWQLADDGDFVVRRTWKDPKAYFALSQLIAR